MVHCYKRKQGKCHFLNFLYTIDLGMKKNWWVLIITFILALAVRFLYFPNDISFTYDQARDAFVSQKIVFWRS